MAAVLCPPVHLQQPDSAEFLRSGDRASIVAVHRHHQLAFGRLFWHLAFRALPVGRAGSLARSSTLARALHRYRCLELRSNLDQILQHGALGSQFGFDVVQLGNGTLEICLEPRVQVFEEQMEQGCEQRHDGCRHTLQLFDEHGPFLLRMRHDLAQGRVQRTFGQWALLGGASEPRVA